jgi:hypothetical protein
MTKAIILTTQRTGSTFLVECLQSHPQVRCIGEMLAGGHIHVPDLVYKSRYATKAWRFISSGAWYPTHMMDTFFRTGSEDVKVFKAMYNHINNRWTLGYFRDHPEIHVLHLRRHNLLAQYVSKVLLTVKRDKPWQPHATAPVSVARTVIDPAAALAYVREKRAQYDHFERFFARNPRYHLAYEHMIDGQNLREQDANGVCDFLHIERRPMHSKLIKMNPTYLREMVTNYDELAKAFSATEFRDMLDAEPSASAA